MRRTAAWLGIVFFLLFWLTGCSDQAPSQPAESVQSLMESSSVAEDLSAADVSSIAEPISVVEENSSASNISSPESETVFSDESTGFSISSEGASNERQEVEAFSSDEDRLQSILNNMTLEEKIGQMILARCPEESSPELAETYHLGG